MTQARLSILDLAPIARGQTAGDTFAASVALAQRAEDARLPAGLVRRAPQHREHRVVRDERPHRARRVADARRSAWARAASCSPNHAPLVIAEQFGTLEALHPGRIDLGLGRAPGTDQITTRALRRAPRRPTPSRRTCSSCRATSAARPGSPGVDAVPGKGANVPLYILGSSLFGAQAGGGPRAALRLRLALRPGRPPGGDRGLSGRVQALRAAGPAAT